MALTCCPKCRGLGYLAAAPAVVPLVECDDPACALDSAQRAAAAALAQPAADAGGRAIFKGGALKLTMAIKGFEVPEDFVKLMTSMAATGLRDAAVRKTSGRRTASSPRRSRPRPPPAG